MDYLVVKWLHVLSSTVLFGTGLGSAFYMFFTNRSGDIRAIAVVARKVVQADWLFTAPTGILQPLTGLYLVQLAGLDWRAPWIYWSIVLYLVAMLCWLPVVWLQIRMARMARSRSHGGSRCRRCSGATTASGRGSACRRLLASCWCST